MMLNKNTIKRISAVGVATSNIGSTNSISDIENVSEIKVHVNSHSDGRRQIIMMLFVGVIITVYILCNGTISFRSSDNSDAFYHSPSISVMNENEFDIIKIIEEGGDGSQPLLSLVVSTPSPKYRSLIHPSCLTQVPENRDERHIVQPPNGLITLVCCTSTKGVFNIAVHNSWAPLGAARFVDMVETNFFSSKVGLFRALKGFLIQFGLAGNTTVQDEYDKKGNLKDDAPWLPLGPPGREVNGVKRFQKGYLAYAGAGVNSRGTQLIMSFEDNLYLGGGSPYVHYVFLYSHSLIHAYTLNTYIHTHIHTRIHT